MPDLFFVASRDFFDEHTQICDLAHASAAALWNMRFHVKGYFAEHGYYANGAKPAQADLVARFLAGSGLRKANFLGLVEGPSWNDLLDLQARANLLSTISLFEGWSESLKEELGLSNDDADALQWPSAAKYQRRTASGTLKPGIGELVQKLNQQGQPDVMVRCIFPTLQASRNCRAAELDALYVCYRAWKEIRNCLVHSGGRATSRAIQDVDRLSGLTALDVGMSWVPRPSISNEGERIYLAFRDVMSFGEVLQKIVTTVDALFASTKRAEPLLWARWEQYRREHYGDASANKSKRWGRIRLDFKGARLPRPANLEYLDEVMLDRYGPFLRPSPR